MHPYSLHCRTEELNCSMGKGREVCLIVELEKGSVVESDMTLPLQTKLYFIGKPNHLY